MFCIKRGDFYHFRMRVPADLVAVVGTGMIRRSLGSKDKRQANKLALELRDRLVPQFLRLRIEKLSGTQTDQLKKLACVWLPIQASTTEEALPDHQMLLSELIAAFLDDRSKQIDELTFLNMRHTFELALFVLGDMSLSKIDRNVCRVFRDTLLQLPPHTLKRHRNKSVEQVLALDEIPMHTTTVNKNIQYLSSMFHWAVREEHIHNNPVKGLSINLKRKASTELLPIGWTVLAVN